jgi:hypothetical protein
MSRQEVVMIPTVLVVALVTGRWWLPTLVIAAVGWPALLVATDAMTLGWGLLGASALATGNALVGVLAHHGAAWLLRRVRDRAAAPSGP